MDRRYKTKRTPKKGFTKQNNSKRYRTLCHYIEETQSMYKPNVQNSLSEIVNYRQSGYFFEKKLQKSIAKCSKVLYIKTTKTIKLQNRSDGMTKTWNRRKIWHH